MLMKYYDSVRNTVEMCLRAAIMGVQTAAELKQNRHLRAWKVENQIRCASASAKNFEVTKGYDHVTYHIPNEHITHRIGISHTLFGVYLPAPDFLRLR